MIKFFRWIREVWQFLVIEQWRLIHKDVEHSASPRIHYQTLVLLCWAAVALTFLEYYGNSGSIFYQWLQRVLPDGTYSSVYRHMYWSLACSTAYFVFPLCTILLTKGMKLRDYGLSTSGLWSHAWVYIVLYLMVLPAVIAVSYSSAFQNTYPFYHLASRSVVDLGLWWVFYGLQFFFLEFFFRGYLLHGTKRALGVYAIFVSSVPYCMIHYGKPMPETLGAIIAGVVLGTLSLRTLSIWSGFLIHISVAYSMDILSLWQKGKFSIFM